MLEELNEIIFKLEQFAKLNGVNINVKIYDIDFDQNTTISYDIPQ